MSIAPPSDDDAVGAPRGRPGGKRCSSGRIIALPSGERPAIASRISGRHREPTPARAKRVAISSEAERSRARQHVGGQGEEAEDFREEKNIGWTSSCLPRLVARLGLVVRRIEAGQRHAALDLAHHPGLVALVLVALVGDEIDQVLRDDHRAVVVGHDHVVGEDRDAAAGDRLLPADEGQPVDRCRRRRALAPDRQAGRDHAGLVAHHAVGDQRLDAALDHPHAQDVAEDAGRGHAHRVGDRDAALRHRLDGGAGRDRRGPACRRRQILAHRHEAQREGRPDDALAGAAENGIGPLIQQRRMPFFKSIVVMVPVVTSSSVATSSGERLKEASGCEMDENGVQTMRSVTADQPSGTPASRSPSNVALAVEPF